MNETLCSFFLSIDWSKVLVFFCCSLINVMLSTVKTILTVKSSRKIATIINAITYGFYAIVVKQLAELSIPITVIVTILTNIIGVYLSMWLLDKFKKDNLWKITVTTPSKNLKSIAYELDSFDIGYTYYSITAKKGVIDIYANNRDESKQIKNVLVNYNVKYCITEMRQNF